MRGYRGDKTHTIVTVIIQYSFPSWRVTEIKLSSSFIYYPARQFDAARRCNNINVSVRLSVCLSVCISGCRLLAKAYLVVL